jgi:hypothetical protein
MKFKFLIFIIFIFSIVLILVAQSGMANASMHDEAIRDQNLLLGNEPPKPHVDTEAIKQSSEDAKAKAEGSLFLVPAPFYSPETSVGVNLLLFKVFPFDSDKDSKDQSNILSYLTYTAKQQIAFSATPTYYWSHGDNLFAGEVGYKSWPDQFFGIGNSTSSTPEAYSVQTLYLRPRLYHRFIGNWSAGPFYELQDDVITSLTPGQSLSQGSIPGSLGDFQSGVGAAVRYDSRDIPFFPSKGELLDVALTDFTGMLGSQYNYLRFTVDGHQYFQITDRNIIAAEIYLRTTNGVVPFESMSILGGNQYMRGVYAGRFRDKDFLLGQIEYRFPIYKRLGAAVFGAMGEVADELADLSASYTQSTAGGGLRYILNVQQQLNVRVDYGSGPYTSGVYIAVGEAL